jgi:site-specific recombinase XerD
LTEERGIAETYNNHARPAGPRINTCGTALAAKTLVQLQAYIDANKIENEAPIFPITQQWVRAIINKYGALLDRNIHPHTFRQSFAINSVRHGVDIRRLQQVLDHSNINTTAVYLKFNDQDLQDVYASVPF